jgi:hypothetical protein
LDDPFVVQERVAVEKEWFPTYADGEAKMEELLIDLDPFIFRGKVEGGLVRLSPQSLVNVAAGGGETSLAVLEDYSTKCKTRGTQTFNYLERPGTWPIGHHR